MTKAQQIKELFLANFKDAKTELNYKTLYELLVSVMLSAQCTDKRVNIITPALFTKYPDTYSLSKASLADVKNFIKSCSFFNNKAINLIKMANQVQNNFNTDIPLNQKSLMSLAGVGQKTANVVMIEYCEANLMAVDTHVTRVSKRLGLSRENTPEKIEAELTKKFKTNLATLHQAMVLFGRYKCKAIKPDCKDCYMFEYCSEKLKNKYLI